jgi:hypothetical protein
MRLPTNRDLRRTAENVFASITIDIRDGGKRTARTWNRCGLDASQAVAYMHLRVGDRLRDQQVIAAGAVLNRSQLVAVVAGVAEVSERRSFGDQRAALGVNRRLE